MENFRASGCRTFSTRYDGQAAMRLTSRPKLAKARMLMFGVFALGLLPALPFAMGPTAKRPEPRRSARTTRALNPVISSPAPAEPLTKAGISEGDQNRLRVNAATPGMNFVALTSEDELTELLNKVGQAGQLLVVDYYAPWCRACQKLLRYVQKIARDEKFRNVEFASVDFERSRELCKSKSVDKLPTMEIYRGQDLKQRWSGANTKRFLERLENEMQEDIPAVEKAVVMN
ncbi:Thioredoxin-like 2-1, chloroplastic [Symbiodinium microadriaticum]|uniref:Thioredoxin-like 2-1, chloroplastic n=1 Tax=Symbiodinium microadriaticum TaxID=2951 RepID=A0A1Q9E033_SYMMI|nr:Thioredoxin-like 2-1, chloroplastic [Symbiodinium microadriaticum]